MVGPVVEELAGDYDGKDAPLTEPKLSKDKFWLRIIYIISL